jgi:RNA polymerase sporulation-specific sigma factor
VTPDHRLCLRVCDGEELAFELLLSRHSDVLHHQVRLFYLPGGDRDDLLQAGLLGLLKAARMFTLDRGSGFRNFAQLAIRAEILTAVKAAGRQKHQVLNEAVRTVIVDHEDTVELGALIPGPESDDPCEIAIRRERLAEQIRVVADCSQIERTVVARRLAGAPLAIAGVGLGTSQQGPAKVADNALSRVRRKLAAAA